VRKVPHTKAEIAALAASIAANGLLQNLIVELEYEKIGWMAGYCLVADGEGGRLAQLLRAKRKEIAKTEPIRCVLDTERNAVEISLAENPIGEVPVQVHGTHGCRAGCFPPHGFRTERLPAIADGSAYSGAAILGTGETARAQVANERPVLGA
jgi:ParB-like nuclease family protein